MEKDLVIVGGGLAGLSLGVLAARRGLSVTIVERHSSLGGRASTDHKGEFLFNRGAHALYNGGAARRVLSSLGIEPTGSAPRTDGGLVLAGERFHGLPGGPISLLWSSVADLAGKLELARTLSAIRKLDTAQFDGMSATEYAAQLRNESARALLKMLFRVSTYCTEFDHFSAGLAISQLRRATYDGVVYLDGGWETLVEALRRRAIDAGVELCTGKGVRAIDMSSGTVNGVMLDESTIRARNVAIAASPGVAASLAKVPSLEHAAARAVPVRAACLELGLSSLPRKHPRVVFGVERPLYLSVHSAFARLAPEGSAVVHLAKYLREDDEPGDAHIAELETLMEQVQPGYRARLLERRVLPNIVVSNARVDAANGGLGGRPDVVVPEVRGLYIAGDWVGREGFLADASFASAEAVADRISVPVALSA